MKKGNTFSQTRTVQGRLPKTLPKRHVEFDLDAAIKNPRNVNILPKLITIKKSRGQILEVQAGIEKSLSTSKKLLWFLYLATVFNLFTLTVNIFALNLIALLPATVLIAMWFSICAVRRSRAQKFKEHKQGVGLLNDAMTLGEIIAKRDRKSRIAK